jgi:hypothetical protein
MYRGNYEFDVDEGGNLKNSAHNLELLKLWSMRCIDGTISGRAMTAISAICLARRPPSAGRGGVRKLANSKLHGSKFPHDAPATATHPSATVHRTRRRASCRDSAEGRVLLRDSKLRLRRGTSVGRVSARNVSDPPVQFVAPAGFRSAGGTQDGGRVWEFH